MMSTNAENNDHAEQSKPATSSYQVPEKSSIRVTHPEAAVSPDQAALRADGPKIKKLLVAISPDLVEPQDPTASVLVRRALQLAHATGAQLEFFHIVYEPSLDYGFFSDEHDVIEARNKCLDNAANLMSEFTARLPDEGLNVEFDVRWDDQRADAIINKAVDSNASMILKQSRDHQFVLGIMSNVDWSLLRHSPVPVWFVKEEAREGSKGKTEHSGIKRIFSAVGSSPDQDEIFQPVDYDVVRLGSTIAANLDVEHKLAHTYTVPRSIPAFVTYEPTFTSPAVARKEAQEEHEARVDVAQKHGARIQAFADYFGFDTDALILKEGHPKYVLPQLCEEHEVDLLVMSVFNRTMLERMLKPVSAEPVLSRAECDVVFVPSDELASENAEAAEGFYSAPQGQADFDLERAIVNPASVFSDPQSLLEAESISVSLRRRILQSWRLDLHGLLTDIAEGGENTEAQVDTLDQVNKCLAALEKRPEVSQSF
ncbi:MAG: universal stress protein [Pseudomonadales bacterium]